MNQSGISAPAAYRPAGRVARLPAYGEHASSYDRRTGAFRSYRRAIVEALPVSQGQVVRVRVRWQRGPAALGRRAQRAAAARRYRPAGLEQRGDEQVRRVDAGPVIGVHVVD